MQTKEKAIFVNKTVMNRKTTAEMLRLTWVKSTGILRYVLYVLAALAIGYGVFQLVVQGSAMLGYAATLLCMALLAAFVATWGYLLRAPANYRQQRKLWGAASLEKEVSFYENHIQQVSPLGKLSFRYEDIGRVVQNKNVLVMVINNAALLIQKDGFTTGAAPEFEAFLREKTQKKG